MRNSLLVFGFVAGLGLVAPTVAQAEFFWIEGEKPDKSTMNRHVWYDGVKKDQLSGGDWISNFDEKKVGEAEYSVTAKQAGKFEFWVRANAVVAKLSYTLNGSDWKPIDLSQSGNGSTNIAADGKIDLRFITWLKVGTVELKAGKNVVRFRMHSENSNHGGLDCFVLSTDPFRPRGILKPGEAAPTAAAEEGWFAFDPSNDTFQSSSFIDLRFLNEKYAGEQGVIGVKGGHFVHGKSGKAERFWAVNGPVSASRDDLKREARQLAKYGVNLVRLHGRLCDQRGEVDPVRIQHAFDVVDTMKAEGIYTHFSIFFPLWFDPPPDLEWMPGYDGKTHSFATLYFNAQFQEKYRAWWKALLTTPNPATGKALKDEPAVFGAEFVNEDSFFFWTFNDKGIPDRQLQEIERQFGTWLKSKYGSFDKMYAAWNGQKIERDNPGDGRIGFRPLWNIANERTARDQDTARFLTEAQKRFYAETAKYLRELGFQGLLTASNWVTASPEVLGPLEKLSYTAGDFIDRHGYFGCKNEGQDSEWSIRDGHLYVDRSGWKFENEEPDKPAAFAHPAMDPHYDNKPSMISETTWNRPNRYRGEAPIYLAVYGALQDSDSIVHFAKDAVDWSVQPGYFMQPWTLTSPTQFGQFPATALIYRRGLIKPGDVMADVKLSVDDLYHLRGTPLPQDAAFDELRLKDVPSGTTVKAGQRIDPLIHYVGRTQVKFLSAAKAQSSTKLQPLKSFIDHKSKTVASSTKELRLDWGRGFLTINAPAAQGASGDLAAAGEIKLADVTLSVPRDTAHVLVVSLDGQPLATSKKMLLQVMTEEKATGFKTEPVGNRKQRIVSIGQNPWLVKKIEGTVRFRRSDAAKLKITALDQFGQPTSTAISAESFKLLPDTVYYSIEAAGG